MRTLKYKYESEINQGHLSVEVVLPEWQTISTDFAV